MNKSSAKSFWIENEKFLFLLLVGLQLFYFAWLVMNMRVPGGHDGLQYFTLQYYFLNGAVMDGEIPNWMPFMFHGTATSWWYLVQASLFQNFFLMTSAIWQTVNFFYIYNINMFFDEFVLLVGTWLLARRFLSSYLSVFFVTVSALCSCLWVTQPWFNLHFYYAIPLILHFLHEFIEKAQWRYLVLGLNLMAMQTVGNLAYYIPVTSLVVCLYFVLYSLFNGRFVTERLRILRFNGGFWVSILIIAFSFCSAFLFLKVGSDQILTLSQGKNVDGSTPISHFLTYGGNLNLHKWKELVYGISPALDFALYIGFFQVFCIVLGIYGRFERRNYHFLGLILILLAMSVGSIVAVFFYHVWPLMKFYRHLALLSPIIKIFLCFLGGFGFDLLVSKRGRNAGLFFFGSACMIVIGIWLFSLNKMDVFHDVSRMVKFDNKLVLLESILTNDLFMIRIQKSIFLAMFFCVTLFLLGRTQKNLMTSAALVLILSAHVWDVYSYKFDESALRTMPLTSKKLEILKFQELPYWERRARKISPDHVARLVFLRDLPTRGALNWSMNSFLFVDEVSSSWRTDYWHRPLDKLMRAYWRQPIDDLSIQLKGQQYFTKLDFPTDHPAVLKVVGSTEDKVQFFSGAHFINDEKVMAEELTDPRFTGDLLFISGGGMNDRLEEGLGNNERVPLPYQVTRFSSNRLELKVDNVLNQNIWMMYSDTWHPFWKVTVNGKDRQLHRADLAYKAVELKPGMNQVEFHFGSKMLDFLQIYFGLNAILWIGIVLVLGRSIVSARVSHNKGQNEVRAV